MKKHIFLSVELSTASKISDTTNSPVKIRLERF